MFISYFTYKLNTWFTFYNYTQHPLRISFHIHVIIALPLFTTPFFLESGTIIRVVLQAGSWINLRLIPVALVRNGCSRVVVGLIKEKMMVCWRENCIQYRMLNRIIFHVSKRLRVRFPSGAQKFDEGEFKERIILFLSLKEHSTPKIIVGQMKD